MTLSLKIPPSQIGTWRLLVIGLNNVGRSIETASALTLTKGNCQQGLFNFEGLLVWTRLGFVVGQIYPHQPRT